MNGNCVSSDSSFYICFSDDLNRRSLLDKVVVAYQFHIGDNIRQEMPESLRNDPSFMANLVHSSCNYFELVRPFFGRGSQHEADAEYEAIGIGHHLNEQGRLYYLILDDRKARAFVKAHFPALQRHLVGTFGFIRDSCCVDGVVFPLEAISILKEVRVVAEKGMKTRPCGIEEGRINEVLEPIAEQIRKMAGLSD
jgi:hypothetical protein